MSKKRDRPKRLFRHPRLDADVVRAIDALTAGDPGMRSLFLECVGALQHETCQRAYAQADAHHRAAILLAWRDAITALGDGRPCDFCPAARARHVRFLAIGPADCAGGLPAGPGRQSFLGFMVVCPSCGSMMEADLVRRMVAEHAEVLSRSVDAPYRRPALIGPRIGEAGALPRRPALEECEVCRETIWIDRDERDRITGEDPAYFCRACGLEKMGTGGLECLLVTPGSEVG
jgi:hypothetical protein